MSISISIYIIYMHACILIYMHTYMYTSVNKNTYIQNHVCKHTYAYKNARIHAYMLKSKHGTCTDKNKHA